MRRLLAACLLVLAIVVEPMGAVAKAMPINPRKVGLSPKDLGPKLHVTDSYYMNTTGVATVVSYYDGALPNGHTVTILVTISSFASEKQAGQSCGCGLALTGTAYSGERPIVVGQGSDMDGAYSSVQLHFVERTVAVVVNVDVTQPPDTSSLTASLALTEHLARAIDRHILAAVGAKPPTLDLQPRLGDTLTVWTQDWGTPLPGTASDEPAWKPCAQDNTIGHIAVSMWENEVSVVKGVRCDYAHGQPLAARLREAMQFFPRDTKSMGTIKTALGNEELEYYSAALAKTVNGQHWSFDCLHGAVRPGLFTYLANDALGGGGWNVAFGTCA